MKKLLIANRGEIAIRIARAAADMGIATVSVFSEDDATSLHTRRSDESRALKGVGPSAYLDIAQIVAIAKESGCDAVHPGYGFLSENAEFAKACAAAGLTFVGPTPETLDLFGNKATARALAEKCDVPVLSGTSKATSLAEVATFFDRSPDGIMIKAIAGGGGRGMRPVLDKSELERAYQLCQNEAKQAFGNGDVYVEQLFPRARHVEVQIVGDGQGGVSHLYERECSIQRQRQKIIEIAPAPGLAPDIRTALYDASLKLAKAANYRNLGTFEFLVDTTGKRFAFIEANARLQVEHTVTEEITGIDLVRAQLDIAQGKRLADIGLDQKSIPASRGIAVQLRVNMETMGADGSVRPAGGMLTAFEPPIGPGIRIDAFGYSGYATNPRFELAAGQGHRAHEVW